MTEENKGENGLCTKSAPTSGSTDAIAVEDYFQIECQGCGSKTNFFAVRDDGTQKCIGCLKSFKINMPND